MSQTSIQFSDASDASSDALAKYVASVRKLNSHFDRIRVGENEIANSLSRAAAALRSIAAARIQNPSRQGNSG